MKLAIGLCLGFALGVALMLGLGERDWQDRMRSMQASCEQKAAETETAYVVWRDERFGCAAVHKAPRLWRPGPQIREM